MPTDVPRPHKWGYRYEVTAVWGLPSTDLVVGAILVDHRYLGKTHEWLIYSIADMEPVGGITGKFIEKVSAT